MTETLETGNAISASRATRGWFVGDLLAWSVGLSASPAGAPSPRQTAHLEVKWFDHPPGSARPEAAPPDESMTIGILIDGELTTEFISESGERTTVTQSRRGDYVIWHGPSYSHRWYTDRGATVLTVRWPVHGSSKPVTT